MKPLGHFGGLWGILESTRQSLKTIGPWLRSVTLGKSRQGCEIMPNTRSLNTIRGCALMFSHICYLDQSFLKPRESFDGVRCFFDLIEAHSSRLRHFGSMYNPLNWLEFPKLRGTIWVILEMPGSAPRNYVELLDPTWLPCVPLVTMVNCKAI